MTASRDRIASGTAFEEPAMSPGKLAVRFTDNQSYFYLRLQSTGC